MNKLAKKSFESDVSSVENTEIQSVEKKPSRKELGAIRSKIDSVEGVDGTFTKCQRANDTGDIQLNFELDGHLVRCTVNPICERVRGRIIHMN